jgi:hypothetical protein
MIAALCVSCLVIYLFFALLAYSLAAASSRAAREEEARWAADRKDRANGT